MDKFGEGFYRTYKEKAYNTSKKKDDYSGFVFWKTMNVYNFCRKCGCSTVESNVCPDCGSTNIEFNKKNKNGFKFSKNEKELLSENIRRILKTRKGERINNPEFGSDLMSYLYMPQMYVSDLLGEIKASIERCEPRVTVDNCTISGNIDDTVDINLDITINNEENEKVNIEVKL